MVEMKDALIRAYRKYFGSPTAAQDHAAGAWTVMDGESAVALCEMAIAQSLLTNLDLGAGSQADDTLNAFGRPVARTKVQGARAVLATAIGSTMAGRRTAAFLDGKGMAAAQDLLLSASGRHLPITIHLTATVPPGTASTNGSSHESFHLAAETGCFTLFARNAQEAVDFSFIARRVAEQTLIPAIVAMDANETAWAPQTIHLLTTSRIREFTGDPDGLITAPTVAQESLFGTERHRVPRWYDADRPVLQGVNHKGDGYALAALGREVYFENILPESLAAAFRRFDELTGRHYEAVSDHRVQDASVVFVAQGSVVETLEAAADYLRAHARIKVGVLGLSVLRPLPVGKIATLLDGKRSIVIFERSSPAVGSEGALTKEIRLVLQPTGSMPRVHSVIYGIGGLPVRIADVASILPRLNGEGPSKFALGVEFINQDHRYPKRQVLLDMLARAYPGIEKAGVREHEPLLVPLEEDTLAFAVQASVDGGLSDLVRRLAETLQIVEGGMIRARVAPPVDFRGHGQTGYLVCNQQALRDPGDEAAVDVLVLGRGNAGVDHHMFRRLRAGAVVVFIDVPGDAAGSLLTRQLRAEAANRRLRFYAANRADQATDPVEFALGAVFAALVDSGKRALKQRRLLAARPEPLRSVFELGYDCCAVLDPSRVPAGDESVSSAWDREAPATVRAFGRDDDQFDSLPRFWDQVGVLYNDGETSGLTVDPYFATGTMAPLSASFRDLSGTRYKIPLLDIAACTACGKCWSLCPEGAVGAAGISPAGLLETGMRVSGGEALRQVAGQLATRMTGQARKGELACHAGEAIRNEYSWLTEKMSLAPERAEVLSQAAGKVAAALGQLPVVTTPPLFAGAEQIRKDSGELFSLAINPDVCKGCGICAEQCEPEALTLVDQTPAALEAARTLWNTWTATPDTPAVTIERLMNDGSMDPLAALGLSRYCLGAMTGGDSAETGSGQKIALRMVLAATEFHGQPLLNRLSHDAEQASERLVQRIQAILASALPGDDLDALERTLEQLHSPSLALSVLAREIEANTEGRDLEVAELKRLTRIAEDLTELQHSVAEGAQGLGRARFGLAIAPGTVPDWAAEFPWNPFQSPAVIDMTGDAVQMAAGLLQGHMRDTCEASALLRRANLEVEKPGGVEFERAAIDRLRWEDLTIEERRICSPLIVVGTDQVLAGYGLSQVLWLLRSTLPLKIVCLTDLDSTAKLSMLAIAARGAYVASTSIGASAHLEASVTAAMEWSGPALIYIHAPSPSRHGFPADRTVAQAKVAGESRAHPLFTYDPRIDGVHGARISLAGNKDVDAAWPKIDGRALTPVHWAFTETRFKDQFMRSSGEDAGVDLDDYLTLDSADREGKTPMLTVDAQAGTERYEIGPGLIRIMDEAADTWRVLQELSGTVTPFTERVREAARQEVAEAHAAEIEALKADYEEKLAGLATNVQNEVAGRIRAQLMRLVKTSESHGQR